MMAQELFERMRDFALALEGAREEFSFGTDHPVYKAANGKIFAICAAEEAAATASVKLSPEEVLEVLTLPFVTHAPYLSKAHWVLSRATNEPELDATLGWIARSYELVTARPTPRKRQ